jgi:16S rRNA (adenine1518-N6/adenine1519-N6)-dimethyltransferase
MTPARPRLGQHFLVDREAVRRIVAALAPRPGEALLEIGPGRGALTAPLLDAAGRAAAVEVDPGLAARLRRRFDPGGLRLFEQNILRTDLAAVLETLAAPPGARLLVVGNLPYHISKPVVQMLIRQREHVDRAVLMFQREVAARLTAPPGNRRYGPLGILAGMAYHIEVLFDLPPRAFAPPPQVVSSVTRWSVRRSSPFDGDEERQLRSVLAVCFARRRRTLRNNLRSRLADDARVDRLLADAGIDGGLRAEAVSPSGFRRLAARWEEIPLL